MALNNATLPPFGSKVSIWLGPPLIHRMIQRRGFLSLGSGSFEEMISDWTGLSLSAASAGSSWAFEGRRKAPEVNRARTNATRDRILILAGIMFGSAPLARTTARADAPAV